MIQSTSLLYIVAGNGAVSFRSPSTREICGDANFIDDLLRFDQAETYIALRKLLGKTSLPISGALKKSGEVFSGHAHPHENESALLELRDSALDRETAHLVFLSHEIRSPVSAMVGFSELLANEEVDGNLKSMVEAIGGNGRYLARLVDSILDQKRSITSSGKLEKIDVRRMMNQLVGPYELSRSNSAVSLALFIEPNVPEFLSSDPIALQRILNNLLSNAVKFTLRGKVLLKVLRATGGVEFEVADEGIGMSEDETKYLFQQYIPTNLSRERRFRGAGLGLYMSSELAREIGGALKLKKSAPDQGSTFSLFIPEV